MHSITLIPFEIFFMIFGRHIYKVKSFKSLMVLSINISLSHSVLFGLRMIAL